MTFLLLHPNHGVVAGRKLYARWKTAGFDAFDRVFSPVTCLLAAGAGEAHRLRIRSALLRPAVGQVRDIVEYKVHDGRMVLIDLDGDPMGLALSAASAAVTITAA